MKIFLDAANLYEIKEAAELGLLDGVTTNLSLVAKEGVEFEKRVVDAAQAGAQVATLPNKVFELRFQHSLTEKGQERLLNDGEKAKAQWTPQNV